MRELATAAPRVSRAHPAVGVLHARNEYRLLAMKAVPAGAILLTIDGARVQRPTRTSVQVDEKTHVDVAPDWTEQYVIDTCPWRFLNHSCEPNAWVRGREVVALRPIEAFEQVTFDYETTEYEMASPFRCGCASASCTGREIRGFRFLPPEEQRRRLPHLSEALRRRVASEAARAR